MIGEFIRKAVAIIVFGAALTTVYIVYEQNRPCVRPIEYRIGTFDPKFGISRGVFVTDLAKAATIWNSAAGKDVLRFSEAGKVPVSLMYDERQKAAELGEAIHEAQQSSEIEKARVDAERASFEVAQAAYEEKVQYWNARGGAPKNVYKELETARATLSQKQSVLNADIAALNARARVTNATVQTYNKNTGQFEQGEYHSDRYGARITLYEFTTETQLVRLAAHEFGHALGLDHVEGVNSIMYPENKGASPTLTAEDLAALKTLCGLK